MNNLTKWTSVFFLFIFAGCFAGSGDDSGTSGNAITIDKDGNTGVITMLPFTFPYDADPTSSDIEVGICWYVTKLDTANLKKEEKIDLALRASQLGTPNWFINPQYPNILPLVDNPITPETLEETNKSFMDFIRNQNDKTTEKYHEDKIRKALKNVYKVDLEKNPNKKVLLEDCNEILLKERNSDKYKTEPKAVIATESTDITASQTSLALADTDCGRRPTSRLQKMKYEKCMEEKKRSERRQEYDQAGTDARNACVSYCDAAALELERRLRMELRTEAEICAKGAFDGKQTSVNKMDFGQKPRNCFCGRAVTVGMRRNCAKTRPIGIITNQRLAEVASEIPEDPVPTNQVVTNQVITNPNEQQQTTEQQTQTTEQQTQTTEQQVDPVIEETTTDGSYFCGDVEYTALKIDATDICHQNCPLKHAIECYDFRAKQQIR